MFLMQVPVFIAYSSMHVLVCIYVVCMYAGVGVVIVYQCTSVDCGCCQEMVVVGCCCVPVSISS